MRIKAVRYDYIIGIDPDVGKSGFALLDIASKKLELYSFSFPELLDYIQYVNRQVSVMQKTLCVIVEAGWLNKAHWHLMPYDTKNSAAAKGNAAGRNHEVGRKIVEMLEHYNIEVHQIKPLRKCWRGKDRKITTGELQLLTHQTFGRCNQEERDAALIAWIYGK